MPNNEEYQTISHLLPYYTGCNVNLPSCVNSEMHSSLMCYPRYLDLAGDEGEYVKTAVEWAMEK